MYNLGLLSRIPTEVMRIILLKSNVIYLLQLRQENVDTVINNILFQEAFWKEYCQGRGWIVPTFPWSTSRNSYNTLNEFTSQRGLAGELRIEDTNYYTWEMVAIISALELVYSNFKSVESIHDVLSATLSISMPTPCIKQLAVELYYSSLVAEMCGSRRMLFDIEVFAERNSTMPKHSNPEDVKFVVGVVTRNSKTLYIGTDNVYFGRRLAGRSVIHTTNTTTTTTVDIQASRNALRQLYQEDDRRQNQSRSGWDNKKGHKR